MAEPAESSIREIKKGIRRATFRARSPKRLWDYCGEWVSAVRQLTAHNIPALGGRVPSEIVGGFTPDISDYAQFNWYEYIWIYDSTAVQFPADARKLARTLVSWHGGLELLTMWVTP
jgi:hypothetical protein